MARPKGSPALALVGLSLVVGLAAWSLRIRGPDEAWAFWGVTILVATAANLAWAPERPRLTRRQENGTALVVAGCVFLQVAQILRVRPRGIPVVGADAAPTFFLVGASALFLLGVYSLLDSWRPGALPPACAACGAPALGARCDRCGAELRPAVGISSGPLPS